MVKGKHLVIFMFVVALIMALAAVYAARTRKVPGGGGSSPSPTSMEESEPVVS